MTKEEKQKKIETAHKDLKDINDVLDNFDKQKANIVAFNIYTNPDYLVSISKSRKKHNLPNGNILFADLHTKEKRKALKMYYDAVQDALIIIELTPIEDKEENK